MTNLEAIKATIEPFTVGSNAIEKTLIDLDMSAHSVYTSANKQAIAKASISVLQGCLALASESQGGFSQSYNIEGLKLKIESISKENGISIQLSQNTIRDKSNVW